MKNLLTGILIITTLFLSSCLNEGIKTEKPLNNSNFEITFLFEYDSIKMYRFYDNGRYHYFTKSHTETNYSCGKNCNYIEKIETK